MRYIRISGGSPLRGRITVQGSKNAALPVLTSCLMGKGTCRIDNCPRISDVNVTLRLLEAVGCKVAREGNTVWVDASDVCRCRIPFEEASSIRSSVLFLGALLGRCRYAALPGPGGCAIGSRPVDLHIGALSAMGVRFGDTKEPVLCADGARLHGADIRLPYPSVGATENSILAAVTAPGITRIAGAACEPEIAELCGFLNLRGARIRLSSGGRIEIEGVKELGPVCYRMRPDRIVAGTYLFAAAATKGQVRLDCFPAEDLKAPLNVLRSMGARIRVADHSCVLEHSGRLKAVPYLETAPYPGFPTDLQSPLLAVLAGAQGVSCIRETVFENRFRAGEELGKMGADLRISGDRLTVRGREWLCGAGVEATDLRSGAALAIAGLCARGLTRIRRIEYIERGYEDICRDLALLGADIAVMQEE